MEGMKVSHAIFKYFEYKDENDKQLQQANNQFSLQCIQCKRTLKCSSRNQKNLVHHLKQNHQDAYRVYNDEIKSSISEYFTKQIEKPKILDYFNFGSKSVEWLKYPGKKLNLNCSICGLSVSSSLKEPSKWIFHLNDAHPSFFEMYKRVLKNASNEADTIINSKSSHETFNNREVCDQLITEKNDQLVEDLKSKIINLENEFEKMNEKYVLLKEEMVQVVSELRISELINKQYKECNDTLSKEIQELKARLNDYKNNELTHESETMERDTFSLSKEQLQSKVKIYEQIISKNAKEIAHLKQKNLQFAIHINHHRMTK